MLNAPYQRFTIFQDDDITPIVTPFGGGVTEYILTSVDSPDSADPMVFKTIPAGPPYSYGAGTGITMLAGAVLTPGGTAESVTPEISWLSDPHPGGQVGISGVRVETSMSGIYSGQTYWMIMDTQAKLYHVRDDGLGGFDIIDGPIESDYIGVSLGGGADTMDFPSGTGFTLLQGDRILVEFWSRLQLQPSTADNGQRQIIAYGPVPGPRPMPVMFVSEVTGTAGTELSSVAPYMGRVIDYGESSIDFLSGGSTIGAMNVTVLDKRTDPTDQTTGWFTSLLGGADGWSAIMGHRILVEQQNEDGSWFTLMDGIVGDIDLDDSLVMYKLAIRDQRERERDAPIFTRSTGISLYPPGMISGYGRLGGENQYGVDLTLLAPPVSAARATFTLDPNGGGKAGVAVITDTRYKISVDYHNDLLEATYVDLRYATPEAIQDLATNKNVGNIENVTYGGVRIHWRAYGSSDPFTVLADMPFIGSTLFSSWGSAFVSPNASRLAKGKPSFILTSDNAANLPANGQDIELKVEYAGVPTEKYPLFIECTFGQLLKDVYDGYYSTEAPRVRYNSAVMDELVTNTPFARVKLTAPADDMRAWVEENIYKVIGAAPALDGLGQIKPVFYSLPDLSITPWQLDDTNITHGAWQHSYGDTANKVVFRYKREYLFPNDPNEEMSRYYNSQIKERDIEFIAVDSSAKVLGAKDVTFEPETIRTMAISNVSNPSGTIMDENGVKVAQGRIKDVFNRFAGGAQKMVISALRSDADVRAAEMGDWVYVASSYMPDYQTGERGINRIGQIISIKEISAAEREFTILDGGPNAVPLDQPELGVLSLSGYSVVVPITSIPVGATARVEYAVGPTVPNTNSGEWIFAASVSSVGNVYTPYIAPDNTVWIRARSEAYQKRPSSWTTPDSIVVPANPFVDDFVLTLDDDKDPVLSWVPMPSALGMQVYYGISAPGAPLATSLTLLGDYDTAPGTLTMTGILVRQLHTLMVRIIPYSGWTGSAVSGTAGLPNTVFKQRLSSTVLLPIVNEIWTYDDTNGYLEITVTDPQYRTTKVEFRTRAGASGTFTGWVADSSEPYTASVAIIKDDLPSRIEWRAYMVDINNLGTEVVFAEGGGDVYGAMPEVLSAYAVFVDWRVPMPADTFGIKPICTINNLTKSIAYEVSEDEMVSWAWQQSYANASPSGPNGTFFTIADAYRDWTYYVKITPYSGPLVGGVPSGVAGLSKIVPVQADQLRPTQPQFDTLAQDVADLQTYVDAKIAGLSWKNAVRAATTAAGTLATSFENGDVIDGVTLVTGDRILIKNQAAASENGIYVVNVSGAPTRATDADAGDELVNASMYVSEGTTNADTQWTCSTNAPITIDTTSLTFVQLSTGGGGATVGTVVLTTASLADGATENGTIVVPNADTQAWLQKIVASAACWVRLYVTSAARSSDSSRLITTNPKAGTGILHNSVPGLYDAGLTIPITPAHELHNDDGPRTTTIYYSVQNKSGSTAALTVTFTLKS
jgi:hypothetical protein